MKPAQEFSIESLHSSSYRWVIEAVLLPLNIAMGLNFFAPASLFPIIMEDYGLSRGPVSLMVASVTVVVTVFVLPGGMIVAKLGSRRALIIGGLLLAAGALIVSMPGFQAVLALRVALGLGIAVILPATISVTFQWFGPKERPIITGINLAGQSLGVVVGMILSVPVAEAIGWQSALSLYGVFALLGVVAWFVLGRTPVPRTGVMESPSARQTLAILKEKNVLLLALACVGPFAVFIGFTTWLPTYYHEVFELPLGQASSLVSVLPMMSAVVNLFSGVLIGVVGLRKPFLILSGSLLPLAAFGTFLFDNLFLITGAVVLVGICFSIFIIILFTMPMELPGISLEKVAVVAAATLMWGNISSVLAPPFVGVMTDVLGSYTPGLSVLALLPLIVLIAVVFLPETGPKANTV